MLRIVTSCRFSFSLLYNPFLSVYYVQSLSRCAEFASVDVIINILLTVCVCIDVFYSRCIKSLYMLEILPRVSSLVCLYRFLRNIKCCILICYIKCPLCSWRNWVRGINCFQTAAVVKSSITYRRDTVGDFNRCQATAGEVFVSG